MDLQKRSRLVCIQDRLKVRVDRFGFYECGSQYLVMIHLLLLPCRFYNPRVNAPKEPGTPVFLPSCPPGLLSPRAESLRISTLLFRMAAVPSMLRISDEHRPTFTKAMARLLRDAFYRAPCAE